MYLAHFVAQQKRQRDGVDVVAEARSQYVAIAQYDGVARTDVRHTGTHGVVTDQVKDGMYLGQVRVTCDVEVARLHTQLLVFSLVKLKPFLTHLVVLYGSWVH